MTLKLYKMDLSPPARAAMMACDIFGVPVEFIDVDLTKAEHRSPEYVKKNPLHTVPVLVDGALVIHDSHAILMYLADKYGKSDSLYPKDIKKRALVNQILFFETSTLFPSLRNVTYPAFVDGVRKPPQKCFENIEEAYGFLEEFLTRSKYLAGDDITIADVSAYATLTNLVYLLPVASEKFPKVQAWAKNLESQSFSKKFNASGAAEMAGVVEMFLDL